MCWSWGGTPVAQLRSNLCNAYIMIAATDNSQSRQHVAQCCGRACCVVGQGGY